MIKFTNFEFIFAITGPKLVEVQEINFSSTKEGAFFLLHLWNDLEGQSKGASSP